MGLGTQTLLAARLLILAWTIIWVTTVPLFHIHLPDISDRVISQSGVAHMVFSPDLPGEFFRFSSAHDGPFAHLSNRASNSPELGFVLSSGDPKDRDVGPPGLFGILYRPPDRSCLRKSVIEWSVVHHRPLVFAAPQGSRAPPAVVSL